MKILELEKKYLELSINTIDPKAFEHWVYANENTIIKEYSIEFYDELIVLDYKSNELKYNLSKLLNINYKRLEKYQIIKILNNLELNTIYKNLSYDEDPYEFRGYFIFEINNLKFTINPFGKMSQNKKDFYKLEIAEKYNQFLDNFPEPNKFIPWLINLIMNDIARIIVNKETEFLDNIEYAEYMRLRTDEIRVSIGKYEIRIEEKIMNRL